MPNDALAAQPDGASAIVRYAPSRRDYAYLQAVLGQLGEGGRLTDQAIGQRMTPPLSADAVRKYRTRHPEVEQWVRDTIHQTIEADKPLVLRRATELALRGSIDHAKFLAQVGGWYAQPEGGGGVSSNIQINLMVPRP